MACRLGDLSKFEFLEKSNLVDIRLNDMVFAGKALSERSAHIDASEDTLKAPS